jgi:hypothetical protein
MNDRRNRPAADQYRSRAFRAVSRAQFERLSVPVWSGQISQRAAFLGSLAAGARAGKVYGDSERSVDAINRAQADAGNKAA